MLFIQVRFIFIFLFKVVYIQRFIYEKYIKNNVNITIINLIIS